MVGGSDAPGNARQARILADAPEGGKKPACAARADASSPRPPPFPHRGHFSCEVRASAVRSSPKTRIMRVRTSSLHAARRISCLRRGTFFSASTTTTSGAIRGWTAGGSIRGPSRRTARSGCSPASADCSSAIGASRPARPAVCPWMRRRRPPARAREETP